MQQNIKIEIGDFLGFCDLNGEEALESSQVEQLERMIGECNDAYHSGKNLVADGVYDRLMDILRKVCPESDLCKYIWEDGGEAVNTDDGSDKLFLDNPMYSICTCKSFDCDEVKAFAARLPEDRNFSLHVSIKENGHGIRIVYKDGELYKARSRARSSAGRDLTRQASVFLSMDGLESIGSLAGMGYCEVRGEMVLPQSRLEDARQFNPEIKSAFSAVASMCKDSASDAEIGLLRFVAYSIYADGLEFETKEDEYSYLEGLGFEVPMAWVVQDITKYTFLDELPGIVSDCESAVVEGGYDIYSDGVVVELDDRDLFHSMGTDTKYRLGNIAVKAGYWKQDCYQGVVQAILWTKGKSKLSPVALVAEDAGAISFKDYGLHSYVMSEDEVANMKDLGVLTAGGNRVTRVPLYEPSNLLVLQAYPGNVVNFRYGGEAGVVPCFSDGTPLVDGKMVQMFSDDYEDALAYGEVVSR